MRWTLFGLLALWEAGILGWARSLHAAPVLQEPLVFSLLAELSSGEAAEVGVHGGLRYQVLEGGELSIASQMLPEGGQVRWLEQPDTLGGGYLFFLPVMAEGETGTAFFSSRLFTSELEPIGRVSGTVETAVALASQVLLRARHSWYSLDPRLGSLSERTFLTKFSDIDEIRRLQSDRLLLSAPLFGRVEMTGLADIQSRNSPDTTPSRGFPAPRRKGDVSRAEEESAPSPALRSLAGSIDAEAWDALLLGGTLAPSAFVAIQGEELIRLPSELPLAIQRVPLVLDHGREAAIDRAADAFWPEGRCQAVHDAEPIFICQGRSPSGKETRLLRLVGSRLATQVRVKGHRRVVAHGDGQAVLFGACEASRLAKGHCWMGAKTARTISGIRPSAALSLTSQGLTEIRLDPKERRIRLRTLSPQGKSFASDRFVSFPESPEQAEFFQQGGFIGQVTQVEGETSFWLRHGERFVGVRVTSDGVVRLGPIQKPVARAVFFGRHALLWGASGFLKESSDGGSTFHEAHFPYETGDPGLNHKTSLLRPRMGCSAVGCRLGSALRIGYSQNDRSAPRAPLPPRLALPPARGGRYRFHCEAVGIPLRSRRAGGRIEEYFGARLSPPAAGSTRLDLELGSDEGYLSIVGPSEGPFGEAETELVFRDRFGRERVSRTRKTKGLFEDLIEAERLTGKLDPVSSQADLTLAADGQHGVVLIRERTTSFLLQFGGGEAIRRLEVGDEFSGQRISGYVDGPRGKWLGARSQDSFSVYRVSDGRVELVFEYPLLSAASRAVVLVGDRLDRLAISLDGELGHYLYPLRPNGELESPWLIREAQVAQKPCAEDSPGFAVVRELAIAPRIEGSYGTLDLNRIFVRYRMSADSQCIEAASAVSRATTGLPRSESRAELESVSFPLTALDQRTSTLQTFRCD